MTLTRALAIAALVLGLAACGGDAVGDANTEQGCQQFRSHSSDAADGLLTTQEWRLGIQDVVEDTAVAGGPVDDAARALLASITQGAPDAEQAQAIDALSEACAAEGY